MSERLFDDSPYDGLRAHQKPGDWTEVRMAREAAIRAVEAAGDPEWASVALDAVYRTAERLPYFHVDAVWQDAAMTGTVDDRAMGGVMRKAARLGWISKTDRVRSSLRSHGSGKPVWRSLVYSGEQP